MDLGKKLRERINLFRHIDFRVVSAEPGRVSIIVKHSSLMEREGGILFGGFIAALLDAVMGAAVYTVNDKKDQATVTLSIEFIRPARSAEYLVEAEVVKKGRNLAFVEGKLSGGGKVFSLARGVWFLID